MLTTAKKKELTLLVRKVLNGTASEKEKQFITKYYDYFNKNDLITNSLSSAEKTALENKVLVDIYLKISQEEGNRIVPFYKKPFIKACAAAVLLMMMTAGVYFVYHNAHSNDLARGYHQDFKNDVPPGGTKATLTLANGSTIVLDSVKGGLLALQGGSRVLKVANGKLAYNKNGAKHDEVLYNTVTTPRGGEYQLVLSDGTKVWLNAASSLKFPVVFAGKERDVTLTGEAYFEVINNREQPFKVNVGNVQIKDLGTHFDVMAYDNETTLKATLLEGKIKIIVPSSPGTKQKVELVPGQQAIVNKGASPHINIMEADVNEAVAWKNGEFSFNNTSIYEIMKQLSRWYDIDVHYQDSLEVFLNGNMDRHVNVSEVFRMLEMTGVAEFAIDGRQITVMQPK
jgi:ferric-dicitrate binding protein FerR (iron transport regulator)